MEQTNFIYRYLMPDNWFRIKIDLLNFYRNNPTSGNTFLVMTLEQVLPQIPEIAKWFDSLNLKIDTIAYISTKSLFMQQTHIDSGPQFLAINFPIHNCDIAETHFYAFDKQFLKKTKTPTTNTDFFAYENTNLVDVGHFTLTQPVLLNVKMPHSIINKTQDDRISLSFRFQEDPWFLTQQ